MRVTFLASLLIFITACENEPSACIEGNARPKAFQRETYVSCSVDATSLEWKIQQPGQQITSSAESVSQSWSTPGTYSVELLAKSKSGKKTDTESKQISVQDVCYECVEQYWDYYEMIWRNGEDRHEICASHGAFISEGAFEEVVNFWRDLDYKCVKK